MLGHLPISIDVVTQKELKSFYVNVDLGCFFHSLSLYFSLSPAFPIHSFIFKCFIRYKENEGEEGKKSVNECVVKGCGKFQVDLKHRIFDTKSISLTWSHSSFAPRILFSLTVHALKSFHVSVGNFLALFFFILVFRKSAKIQSILFYSFLMKYVEARVECLARCWSEEVSEN